MCGSEAAIHPPPFQCGLYALCGSVFHFPLFLYFRGSHISPLQIVILSFAPVISAFALPILGFALPIFCFALNILAITVGISHLRVIICDIALTFIAIAASLTSFGVAISSITLTISQHLFLPKSKQQLTHKNVFVSRKDYIGTRADTAVSHPNHLSLP